MSKVCSYCSQSLSGSYPKIGEKCTCNNESDKVTHTHEPWKQCGGATPAYSAIHSEDGYIVFSFAERGVTIESGKFAEVPDSDTQRKKIKRIIDCVNVMGGYSFVYGKWTKTHDRIDNPADLRTQLDEMTKELDIWKGMTKGYSTSLGKAETELADLQVELKVAKSFVNDMAEYDCEYPNDPCLAVHISKLGHGMCIGCKARQAIKEMQNSE